MIARENFALSEILEWRIRQRSHGLANRVCQAGGGELLYFFQNKLYNNCMFKKIVYLVVLILLSLCVVERVRIHVFDNWFFPPMYTSAQKSDNYMLYLKCGQIKLMAKDYDSAKEIFMKILRNANSVSDKRVKNLAFYYLGNTFYETEEYEGALKAYAVVLKNEPGNRKALKKYSRIKMAKGEYVSLYPFVSAYIKAKPKDAFGYTERCALLTRLDKLSHARQSCEQAIELRKGYARAHYDLGLVYEKQGFKDLANEEYDLAKRNQPKIKSREELEAMLNIKPPVEDPLMY